MRAVLWTAFFFVGIVLLAQTAGEAAEDEKDMLEGVWVAQSMESDGKPVPPEEVKRMRFTFRGDTLLLRGNYNDDREVECAYKVDPKTTPKNLDFTPSKENKPILGIYEVMGNELKVCLRHASSPEARPTEFATKQDSKLVLIVFKKQKT